MDPFKVEAIAVLLTAAPSSSLPLLLMCFLSLKLVSPPQDK